MDLKTLRYFVVVAEERNITHAAKILLMSQPPLSNQIKNLEEELGVTLFIRGKRSLTLTEEGKYLYQKAKDILALADKTSEDIASMGKGLSGTISIGITRAFDERISANWFAEFQNEHPQVRFRIHSESSDALVEKMRLGLITLAIIAAPYDEVTLNSIALSQRKLVACCAKESSHFSEGPKPFSLSELVKAPLIVPARKEWSEIIRKWFRKLRAEPSFAFETDDWRQALSLAKANLGVAVIPEPSEADTSLIVRDIEGETKGIRYFFVWRKGQPLPTIEEHFIDFIKAMNQ